MIEWILLSTGILQILFSGIVVLCLQKKYSISRVFAVFGAVMYIISMVRYPMNQLTQVYFQA
ncbi:MAG: hypothetical protein HXS44_12480 [Theionarchaea archaeon]|nr:hypothetical protein [Theionarchaea archaeon]